MTRDPGDLLQPSRRQFLATSASLAGGLVIACFVPFGARRLFAQEGAPPAAPAVDPNAFVRIGSDDGREVPRGEVGEIWLKGPTVIRGYFNLPDATAQAFVDGWFRTGDAGRLDDDGYLYVVDRLKDVVIRGGENIYAAEVEAALYEHPDVTEAAIIGVPHDRLGEEVGAVVRVREGSTLSVDDVRAHVGARLAGFKVPTHVWISTDELPRNATGKVLKRELRTRFVGSDKPAIT